MFSRQRDQAAQDAETIDRLHAALEDYFAATGPGAMVSVSHVMDLLNPRGMWSLQPRKRTPPEPGPAVQQPVPGTDPITGCKPVTPPGTA